MPVEYQVDDALNETIQELLKGGEFPDAEGMRVKAVFAKGSAPGHKEAASCRKIPRLLRLLGDYDFVLVFWSNNWNQLTTEDRLILLCHELWHVRKNPEEEPTLRPHGGDFCELPEHDAHSRALAKRVTPPAVMARMPRQMTFD